jgi:transcription-repair coupling factor (superfamily II helicase)
MKDLFEQLEEMSAKLADLKAFAEANASSELEMETCCDGECECYTEETITLRRGEVIEAPEDEDETDSHELAAQAQMIVFTRAELLEFATKLTERVITAAKEAVTDTSIDADDLVSLELNVWNGNTIDIELDKDKLVECIHSEIDDAIDTDEDAVEDEVTAILSEMYSESIS